MRLSDSPGVGNVLISTGQSWAEQISNYRLTGETYPLAVGEVETAQATMQLSGILALFAAMARNGPLVVHGQALDLVAESHDGVPVAWEALNEKENNEVSKMCIKREFSINYDVNIPRPSRFDQPSRPCPYPQRPYPTNAAHTAQQCTDPATYETAP